MRYPIPPRYRGFTLLELLLVVVVLGILAAFVLGKFSDLKSRAYVGAMKNDLRNYVTAQELAVDRAGTYAELPTDLAPTFHFTDGVRRISSAGDASGWSLTVVHAKGREICTTAGGTTPGAGRIQCGLPQAEIQVSDSMPPAGTAVVLDATSAIAALAFEEPSGFGWFGPAPLQAATIDELAEIRWDFGDGQYLGGDPESYRVVTHTYPDQGTYEVLLTLRKKDGKVEHGLLELRVGAPNQAPLGGSFSFTPVAPKDGDQITFTATGWTDPEGQPISYSWSFGDGTYGDGEVAQKTYSASGTFTVFLTAYDPYGLSGSSSQAITIASSLGQQILGPAFTTAGWSALNGATFPGPTTLDFSARDTSWANGPSAGYEDRSTFGAGSDLQGCYTAELTGSYQEFRYVATDHLGRKNTIVVIARDADGNTGKTLKISAQLSRNSMRVGLGRKGWGSSACTGGTAGRVAIQSLSVFHQP